MSRFLNRLLKTLAIILNDVFSGALITFRYLALLRRESIDLLHLNNWFDPYWITAAKLARVPIIQHIRGIASSNYYPFCHWPNKVICISRDIRERLIQRGIDPGKIAQIYNAIDSEEFRCEREPKVVRSEIGINDSSPLVAIFGNIKRWKGQDLVVRACAKLKGKYPSIKCVLFGEARDEDYHSEIEELAARRENGGLVVFAGYRADVADCMNASDIIIHASISPEPFGRVVIEAMTLGKPVVASNGGAIPEIIEDGVSGLLFEPGNAEELSQRIDFLLQHPEKASRLGENAIQRVSKDFDIKKQVALIEEIYGEIL
jgi:glycosyltransferase involved in cell wall biosynthesis